MDDEAGTRNQFSGDAENVVQVGNLHGDVNYNYYNDSRPADPRRQVPSPAAHFTNQMSVLRAIDEFAVHKGDRDGPKTVVLHGLPGIGKSAVARHWAHLRGDAYPDGHFYIDLTTGTVSDGLKSFLGALGLPNSEVLGGVDALTATFRSLTTGRRVLVVVDDALTESQVRTLLPGAGRSLVLVTAERSLAGLNADGAVRFVELSPLAQPAARDLLARIVGEDRVRAEPVAVDAVVHACGCLPIALCVAGSLLTAFPTRRIARLARDLGDERRRLRTMSKSRDRSVTAVFNAAYQRLSPSAGQCYRVVGLHPGSDEVRLEVLVAALDLPADEVQDAVDELLVASLVQEPVEDRYGMHELVRLHAREQAEATDSEATRTAMLRRVFRYYLDHAVAADALLMPRRGMRQLLFPEVVVADLFESADDARDWMARERTNLSAIVEAAHSAGDLELVCLLCVALWSLHEPGKHLDDQIKTNQYGVDAARFLRKPDWASLLLCQQGFGYLHRGDWDKAIQTFGEALESGREPGCREIEATALEGLGLARLGRGDEPEARVLLRENVRLAEQIGNDRRTALARFHVAKVEPPEIALPLLDQAYAVFVGVETDRHNVGKVLTWQGRKRVAAQDFAGAEQPLDAALSIMAELDRAFDRALVLEILGDLEVRRGDSSRARGRYEEALTVYETRGFSAQAEQMRQRLAEI